MAQRTITWTNPGEYVGGEAITPAEKSSTKVHVFKDNQEVYVTLPGVESWPIEVNRGETNSWSLTAEINGVESAQSAPFSYTEPFPTPMAPIIGSIS